MTNPKPLVSRTEEVVVAHMSDVPEGTMHSVNVRGRPYVIVNLDGTLHALSGTCPHQGGPLGAGKLTGAMMPCAPGEFRFDLEGRLIECPWHRWKYSVETGQAVFGIDRRTVPSFRVRTVGDDILLTVRARPATP